MLHHPHLKRLLPAGILTGLVLATVLAFTWRDMSRTSADAVQTGTTLTTATPADTEAGRAESEQLRKALDTMRLREQEYQAQIEAANRTIAQLQAGTSARRADDRHGRTNHTRTREHREDQDD